MVYWVDSMVNQNETMLNCSASMVFQNKTIKAKSVTRDDDFKATLYISIEKICLKKTILFRK
jgi:hypothetical protein